MTKRVLLPLLLLLAFGLFKTPFEGRLLQMQRAQGFQLAQLNLNVRTQLGQAGFVAALSGFRAIMADSLWIRAGSAFDQTAWPRMELLLHSATQLQPRAVLFWEMAHYHMAYDAATAMRLDEEHQSSSALRRKAELEYIRIGETFLKDGLTFNPTSARLWERLGDLYSRRLNDHPAAAEAYDRAAVLPGAMGYIRRFAAYEVAKVPGKEREAYARLKSLALEGPAQRLPTLLHLLQNLEEKLAVPQTQRVYNHPSATDANPPPETR